MAVERDVGRVQVQHDFGGRRGVRLDVEVSEQPVDGFGRVADLVIASCASHQLQPVQRAFAGQRRFQFPLAAEQSQQRIRAQLLVVVQVLVAQRQPVDALRQHLPDRVLHLLLIAPVTEAGGQTPQQVDLAIHLTQQQSPTVRGDLTGGEASFHTTRKMSCKCERFLVTLCHQKGRLRTAINYVHTTQLCHEKTAFPNLFQPQLTALANRTVRNAG